MTRKLNNIEKKLSGGGSNETPLDLNQFIKIASETPEEEFELDLSTGLLKEFKEALKEDPKLKFKDWLSNRRGKYSNGGVTRDTLAEEYGDLIDAWVRKIDLDSPDQSLTDYINKIKARENKGLKND